MKPSGRSNGLYFDNDGKLLFVADEIMMTLRKTECERIIPFYGIKIMKEEDRFIPFWCINQNRLKTNILSVLMLLIAGK